MASGPYMEPESTPHPRAMRRVGREMAKRKEDVKYGTAQAKVAVGETLRVAYKHGTPLEGGHIAESERVDLFSSAHNISPSQSQPQPRPGTAPPPPPADDDSNTPNKTPAASTSTG